MLAALQAPKQHHSKTINVHHKSQAFLNSKSKPLENCVITSILKNKCTSQKVFKHKCTINCTNFRQNTNKRTHLTKSTDEEYILVRKICYVFWKKCVRIVSMWGTQISHSTRWLETEDGVWNDWRRCSLFIPRII